MLLHEAKRYLDSFVNYEAKLSLAAAPRFDLRRVEALLKELGDPHKKLQCLHAAGTNGKGSVCAFSASILQRLGYKVGLYTSPHLWDLKERIRVLDSSQRFQKNKLLAGQITEEELCDILTDMQPHIEAVRRHAEWGELTFFEVLTAIAFCYFYQKETDFVVLETGLGGRLDATNVAQGKVCGLTPISLEHTQWLGPTLTDIAQEKAAIIKDKIQKVVVAPQSTEAGRVIEDHCHQLGIRPVVIGRDVIYKELKQDEEVIIFSLKTSGRDYPSLRSCLTGEYQMMNAAMAIAMVEALVGAEKMDPEKVSEALSQTVWPGRFEMIRHHPIIIVDGAHNPSAAQHLARTARKLFPDKKIRLIFGISGDKNRTAVAAELDTIQPEEVVLTQAQHPRAVPAEDLQGLFAGKISVTRTVPEAVELALSKAAKDDVIIATGSLFVVAEVKKYL